MPFQGVHKQDKIIDSGILQVGEFLIVFYLNFNLYFQMIKYNQIWVDIV